MSQTSVPATTPTTAAATAKAPASRENTRRTEVGKVVSTKMTKTIVVEVEQAKRHRRYEKILRRQSRRFAHDEEGKARLGDIVEIEATRRLSKNKRWRLLRVVRAADPNSQIVVPGVTT